MTRLSRASSRPDPAASSSRPPTPGVIDPVFGDDWWQRGVVYQVYPRSFADSNDDGIGDLPGLISKLDYLDDRTERSLGIDAIWLSPIHPSPGLDGGYDVADYEAIHPAFGSLEDFDRLIAEAHRRGIRIILDLVMNHTSSAHAWFRASREDPGGPFGDWYIWRDGRRDRLGRLRPPNNWVSFFGGSAWTWDPARGQFYLHTFLPEQPDVNWREPGVRDAMLAMVRGWLDRGVDGFRLDVFTALLKHPDLPSNPRRYVGRRAYARQHHRYDKDQPDLVDLMADFRALVDSHPGRMSVGEPFSRDRDLLAKLRAPRHLVFDFDLLHAPWRAASWASALARQRERIGDAWPTVVLSNHDQPRQASRLSPRAAAASSDAVARAAAVVSLTLRGTPFLYYGEEIGARDVEIPWPEIVDTPARRGGRLGRRFVRWWDRDRARTPMPWGGDPHGGFSRARPWLRMAPDAATRNVAAQEADPRSVLATYRRLIRLRQRHPALQVGSYRRPPTARGDVLAYERDDGSETVAVVVNFGRAPAAHRLPDDGPWTLLFATHDRSVDRLAGGSVLTLGPREGIVLGRGAEDLAEASPTHSRPPHSRSAEAHPER